MPELNGHEGTNGFWLPRRHEWFLAATKARMVFGCHEGTNGFWLPRMHEWFLVATNAQMVF